MKVSVSEFLKQEYGGEYTPGKKGLCVLCNRNTMSIKADDSMAKCFHNSCNLLITSRMIKDGEYSIYKALDILCNDFHGALVEEEGRDERPAYIYLKDERQLAEEVILSAWIGVVPANYDIDALFGPLLNALEENTKEQRDKLNEIEARDKYTKAYEFYKRLKDLLPKVSGNIAFFYTDETFRIQSIRFRSIYAKKFASIKLGNMSGVFGLNFTLEEEEE